MYDQPERIEPIKSLIKKKWTCELCKEVLEAHIQSNLDTLIHMHMGQHLQRASAYGLDKSKLYLTEYDRTFLKGIKVDPDG